VKSDGLFCDSDPGGADLSSDVVVSRQKQQEVSVAPRTRSTSSHRKSDATGQKCSLSMYSQGEAISCNLRTITESTHLFFNQFGV